MRSEHPRLKLKVFSTITVDDRLENPPLPSIPLPSPLFPSVLRKEVKPVPRHHHDMVLALLTNAIKQKESVSPEGKRDSVVIDDIIVNTGVPLESKTN